MSWYFKNYSSLNVLKMLYDFYFEVDEAFFWFIIIWSLALLMTHECDNILPNEFGTLIMEITILKACMSIIDHLFQMILHLVCPEGLLISHCCSGNVSTANNGGFTSVRTRVSFLFGLCCLLYILSKIISWL